MDNFNKQSVKELQAYLKARGVITANYLKAGLVELCTAANDLGICVDPDGLLEDRDAVLQEKLLTDDGLLPCPTPLDLTDFTSNIALIPQLNVFDIYNYLTSFSDFNHGTFRDINKMEGYTMAKDGYVLEILFCVYSQPPGYHAIRSKVKPRTQERDPITKLKYYNSWIILKDADDGRIVSAHCSCKGGYVNF